MLLALAKRARIGSAAAGPMRRIEITVERHSISRVFPGESSAAQSVNGAERELVTELQKPPDS